MAKSKRRDRDPLVVMFAVFLMLAIVGGGYYFITQTGTDTPQKTDCEQAPKLSLSVVDAINRGSNISVSDVELRLNGQYVGQFSSSREFQIGDNVELLLEKANYIADELPSITIDSCGTKTINGELYATSENSFRIFNTNNNLLTDDASGGATNQTKLTASGSFEVKIDSTTDESTGDLVIVIEAGNTSQVDDLVLSGFPGVKKVDVPEFYSNVGANAIQRAYQIDALKDGATESGTLKIVPEASATIEDCAVYVTAYSIQGFVDTDGSFDTGVEDSEGTAKYEDTWDFDFYIE